MDLLCHSRASLSREEFRPFRPAMQGDFRDSSRAPDTRAGMTRNASLQKPHVTILQYSIRGFLGFVQIPAPCFRSQPYQSSTKN